MAVRPFELVEIVADLCRCWHGLAVERSFERKLVVFRRVNLGMREIEHRAEAAAFKPALKANAVVKRVFEGMRVPRDILDCQIADARLLEMEVARVMIGRAE